GSALPLLLRGRLRLARAGLAGARGRRGGGGAGLLALLREVDATRGRREHPLQLPAHPGELLQQGVALALEVGDLRADLLLLGPRLGARLVADLGGLLLRRLEDALHAVGEAADHVGGVAPLLRSTRPRTGRDGPRAARRGHAERKSTRLNSRH